MSVFTRNFLFNNCFLAIIAKYLHCLAEEITGNQIVNDILKCHGDEHNLENTANFVFTF